MKIKSLLILVVLALLLAAGAYLSNRKAATGVPDRIGQKPLADRDFNAVTRISIIGPNTTTTVVRTESGWVLPEAHNYLADFEKIRGFIRTLAELKISDVLRLDATQKGELDLNEPAAPAGAGTQILLSGPKDQSIACLLVGKRPKSANPADEMPMMSGDSVGARFVALEDGAIVRVENPLDQLPNSAKEWLDPQFLSAAEPELVRLSVSGPDRAPILLSRAGPTAAWTLTGLPPDETLDAEKIMRISSSLSSLRFSEVADPALPAEKTGFDKPARIDAETADGRRYSVLFGQSEAVSASRYIRVEMAYNPPPIETPAASTNAAVSTPSPADAAAERAKKAEETQKFNQRFGTWTYLLDEFSANLLLFSRADLLQQKPQPPPPEAEATPTPTLSQGDR